MDRRRWWQTGGKQQTGQADETRMRVFGVFGRGKMGGEEAGQWRHVGVVAGRQVSDVMGTSIFKRKKKREFYEREKIQRYLQRYPIQVDVEQNRAKDVAVCTKGLAVEAVLAHVYVCRTRTVTATLCTTHVPRMYHRHTAADNYAAVQRCGTRPRRRREGLSFGCPEVSSCSLGCRAGQGIKHGPG